MMSFSADAYSPASSPRTPSSSPWIRKPLAVVRRQESQHNNNAPSSSSSPATNRLHRHLTLIDLLGIGVGGTVGSGIFVLTGQIAAQYAGKACWLSLGVAGAAACLSGACYAELSSRIPAAGSTYVYAYVCWGELAAVAAAACLTLEYGVAGAAVARTWGDKVLLVLSSAVRDSSNSDSEQQEQNNNNSWLTLLQPGGLVNLPAFLVSAVSTALLLSGVKESKRVMNWVTLFKMLVVTFMVVGGFWLYSTELTGDQPFAPFGASGVLRGATTSFFGYLGYDEVCCVAGEAKHPARDMPRAVLGTLLIVTQCYILAAIALTGMVPYTEISPTAGFPDAFAQRDWEWAARLTAVGEILSLPVVVLISLMAQPRLTLSMAVDGLLPRIFGTVDASGNLRGGTLVSGVCMTIISTFVPFTYLDDLISAGILFAFCMTNSCLVLLRCQSPLHQSYLLEVMLVIYNALCFLTAMLWSHTWTYLPLQRLWAVLSTLATMFCLVYLAVQCPRTTHFGGSILSEGEYTSERHITHHHHHHRSTDPSTAAATNTTSTTAMTDDAVADDDDASDDFETEQAASDVEYFATPAVPYLPCLGMAVNWYLIAQLDITGILLLCLYLGLTIAVYWFGCAPNSVGHQQNWSSVHGDYQTVTTTAATASSSNTAHRATANNSMTGEEMEVYEENNEPVFLESTGKPRSMIRTNSL